MSAYTSQSTVNFGRRLARLRQVEGYTQKQLAEEIGVTRRMIAYYETESEHPPTRLLIDLARALNITCDELLGVETLTTFRFSRRLLRQLDQIEKLGPQSLRRFSSLVNTFIKTEQLNQQTISKP